MEYAELAKELIDALRMFKKIMRSSHFFEEMSFNEVMVCGVLMHQEENQDEEALIQVKDLSDKMKLSRPALNAVINKLEENNLVERVRHKGDRKSVYVKLTEKSREKYILEQDKLISIMNKIVSNLGKEDTIKLIELLTKFHKIASSEVN